MVHLQGPFVEGRKMRGETAESITSDEMRDFFTFCFREAHQRTQLPDLHPLLEQPNDCTFVMPRMLNPPRL
jgi:hypothetical protein